MNELFKEIKASYDAENSNYASNANLDAAFKETEQLICKTYNVKTLRSLQNSHLILKDNRCNAIDIFEFNIINNILTTVFAVLRKYHLKQNHDISKSIDICVHSQSKNSNFILLRLRFSLEL